LADEYRKDGLPDGEISEQFRRRRGRLLVMEARQAAYVGWLVANPEFVDEVIELRAVWGAEVTRLGRFPSFPNWPVFEHDLDDCVPEGFLNVCMDFYRRWGLMRLLTWDWPVPMQADLAVGMLRDRDKLADAGAVIFVPWYMLRDDRLNLQDVAQDARTAMDRRHLWPWLKKPAPRKNREKGDVRYRHMRWIYRYHELVLMRRYAPASRGHVQGVDRALAAVLGKEEDTVKKLRLELGRVHRAAEAPSLNAGEGHTAVRERADS
jgi:hypothetical protein